MVTQDVVPPKEKTDVEYLWKSASLHTTDCGLPVVAGLTCELCLHALQERRVGSVEV